MAYFGCCGNLRGEKMINYSTNEQDTGIKWIDGKSIYQKTYNYTSISSDETTEDLTTLSIETIVNIEGTALMSTGQGNPSFIGALSYLEPRNISDINVNTYYQPSNKIFYIRKANNLSITSMFFTIWYTKSTS